MNDQTTAPPRPDAPSSPPLRSLRRSRDDRWIGGVSGGVARHFNVDPVLVRIAFVVLLLVGAAGIVLYGALWLFVPEDGEERSIAGRGLGIADDERLRTGALVVAAVLALAAVVGDSGWGPAWGLLWFLVWVAIPVGVLYWYFAVRPHAKADAANAAMQATGAGATPSAGDGSESADNGPESTIVLSDPLGADAPGGGAIGGGATGAGSHPVPPRPRREPKSYVLVFLTLSFVAIALGGVGLWHLAYGAVPLGLAPASALVIIGAGLVVGAWRGNGGWLVPFGILAAVALAVTTVVPRGPWGNQNLYVEDLSQLESRYEFGVGEFVLDLTDLTAEDLAGRSIHIDSGWGVVRVLVDEDVPVDYDVELVAGVVETPLWRNEAHPRDDEPIRWTTGGPDQDSTSLTITIDHTFGEVQVMNP